MIDAYGEEEDAIEKQKLTNIGGQDQVWNRISEKKNIQNLI